MVALALLAALATAAGGAAAAAEARVDPRYPYTAELSAGVVLSNQFNVSGRNAFSAETRALFAGPVAENIQALGGVAADTDGRLTGMGGVRFLFAAEPWHSHAELHLTADVLPSFALGVRGGVGLLREMGGGWLAGAALAAGITVIDVRIWLGLSGVVARSW